MTPACARCSSPLEQGDLRCCVCALPVEAEPGAAISRAHAKVLRCSECGAAIAYDAAREAPACGFCRAVMALEEPADPIEEARLRIPFTVDREAATAALRGWLGKRGYFSPATLHHDAVFESLTPLAWAAWIVRADAKVAWTADSDEGARRSAWAPHAGNLELELGGIAVPASRGLAADEAMLLVPYYDLDRAIDAAAPALAGEPDVMIERFDAQRSSARAQVQRAIEAVAKTRVERGIPGRRYRNVDVACLIERQSTERVALPAWVLAYRFRGSPYRAIVHGQRPEIVFGSAPIDWNKVARVVGLSLAAALAILAIVLALAK